ncbi:MAG: family 10 glycosylhydrolase, partial [Anaerolineae bacterium]
IVSKAADANFNILLFQVRGQADAYYQSQHEPWADRLTGALGQDPGWDPLATAIDAAHQAGLELHAYVNVYPVWLGSDAPPANTTPQHMYHRFNNLYGNQWVQWHENGTPMGLNSSYLTASPGHPGVADHIVAVCRDILQKYDVDGLHLDYVRYSGPLYSHDPVSEQRFAQAQPAAWADWQRSQITQLVGRLYGELGRLRPHAALSVAAWPIYQDKWGWVTYGSSKYDGYDGYYQDSRGWLRAGKADFLAPMLYGTSVQNYLDRYQILVQDFVNESYGRHVYVGIHAGYSDFSEIEKRIEIAREAGAQGQAIFAYSLVEGNDYWDDFKTGPYAEPAQVPPMAWKD